MSSLSRIQFNCLVEATKGDLPSQRALAEILGCSLGTVNKLSGDLQNAGYIQDRKITESGLIALEPYRVKRAVFLAAGFGSRLVPITLNTPKPLVRVNGKRIIDSLLDAVIAAGIDEIYIVRGYLADQFDQLLYKYPMIKFLENPVYNESNNISSALCARYLLQNAYVFEADLLLYDPSLITKYQYRTNILAFYTERSEDWCFTVKNKVITEQKIGGENCYQMVGIWYIDKEDGLKMSTHIKEAYERPGGKERFWDRVAFEYFKGEYAIEVRECQKGDVVEIDTFNELKAIDKTYNV